jgi:hypothetical protein
MVHFWLQKKLVNDERTSPATYPLTGQEYPVVRFQQNLDDELLGER